MGRPSRPIEMRLCTYETRLRGLGRCAPRGGRPGGGMGGLLDDIPFVPEGLVHCLFPHGSGKPDPIPENGDSHEG
jgi:hypothetical protein